MGISRPHTVLVAAIMRPLIIAASVIALVVITIIIVPTCAIISSMSAIVVAVCTAMLPLIGAVIMVARALSCPITPLVLAHGITRAASVKYIDAIAWIVIIIVIAAAIADIGKAITIVAAIIIIEGGIWIAAIARIGIVIIAFFTQVIAARKTERGGQSNDGFEQIGAAHHSHVILPHMKREFER